MAHVFISYVRENQDIVDRLCKELQAYGVEYWIDREHIEPGQRWQQAIRSAVEAGAFFIACFSDEYIQRSTTYMNEELVLAIDQLRLRPIDRPWFIPVRLSDCTIPHREIGGGETLQDIEWVDLHDDNWQEGIRRIIRVVHPTAESRKTTKTVHYEVRIHDGTLRLGSNYKGQYWYQDPIMPLATRDWKELDPRVWDNDSQRVSDSRIGDVYDAAIGETGSAGKDDLEIVIIDSEDKLYHHCAVWKNEKEARIAELAGKGSTYHGQTHWNLICKFAGKPFSKPSRIVGFRLINRNTSRTTVEDTDGNLWAAERNFDDGRWTTWTRTKAS